MASASYRAAGVDTAAGDRAVELMRSAVSRTHGPQVVGGVGGFAGLYDAAGLAGMRHPVLATSTDGVGTKLALARALGRYDTVGQDLVGMVVDDIVVVGARPLFLTDYIACGTLVPERIATIVRGIAEACEATGTALIGGETAEHPGVMGADDYDLAGAATGVVEQDAMLGPDRVDDGDTILALSSSGLHSNGFSLVRHILADRGIAPTDRLADLGVIGDTLLTPTRLYTTPLLRLIDDDPDSGIHALSHVTGGGIAANLARVLPRGAWAEVDRSTWSPQPVFRVLCDLGGLTLADVEDTWNLGVGFFAIVAPSAAGRVVRALEAEGISAWPAGVVSTAPRSLDGFVRGAKGVDGGSVRLVGAYRA